MSTQGNARETSFPRKSEPEIRFRAEYTMNLRSVKTMSRIVAWGTFSGRGHESGDHASRRKSMAMAPGTWHPVLGHKGGPHPEVGGTRRPLTLVGRWGELPTLGAPMQNGAVQPSSSGGFPCIDQ